MVRASALALMWTLACSPTAFGQEVDDRLAKEFAEAFTTDDGVAVDLAYRHFKEKIPEELYVQYLRRIWVLSSSSQRPSVVKARVGGFLLCTESKRWAKDPILQAYIHSAQSDGDWVLRLLLLRLSVFTYPADVVRPLVLSFLGDGNDVVREAAVRVVGEWKDGKEILGAYTRMHGEDRSCKESVRVARWFLGRQQVPVKGPADVPGK